MNEPYNRAIAQNVQNGFAHGLTSEQLCQPLIEHLAIIIVATQQATGANLEDLTEIVRHRLDQRVTHYANICRTR